MENEQKSGKMKCKKIIKTENEKQEKKGTSSDYKIVKQSAMENGILLEFRDGGQSDLVVSVCVKMFAEQSEKHIMNTVDWCCCWWCWCYYCC